MKKRLGIFLPLVLCAIFAESTSTIAATHAASADQAVSANLPLTSTPTSRSVQQSRKEWGAKIEKISAAKYYEPFSNRGPCAARPDYECTGLMVAAFEPQSDPYYWMTNTPALDKLSMTYLTAETSRGSANRLYGGAGFMLWPSAVLADQLNELQQPNNAFPTVYRCIFPQDAATNARADNGCGAMTAPFANSTSSPCQSQGIDSAQAWLNAYEDNSNLALAQCGFALQVSPADDKKTMNMVMQIEKTLLADKKTLSFGSYDEVVLQAWASTTPGKIPLLGFFYVEPDSKKYLVASDPRKVRLSPGGDLQAVQNQQLTYYQKTGGANGGIFAPIIQISGKSWNEVVWTYVDALQAPQLRSIDTVNVLPQ